MQRIPFLFNKGIFEGWLMKQSYEDSLRQAATFETWGTFDRSLAINLESMPSCGEHSSLKTKYSLMQISENVFQVLLIAQFALSS